MSALLGAAILVTTLLTIVIESVRQRTITLLTLLTASNFAYVAVNPLVFVVSPTDAHYFSYLVDFGGAVTESGLTRLFVAMLCFQGACLIVALSNRARPVLQTSLSELAMTGFFRAGMLNMALGVIGIVLLGLRFNGNPLGLYQLAYGRRTEFIYSLGPLAFMLDLFQYGACIIIAAALSTGRWVRAAGVLLVIVVHGLAMKSKFPIFYTSVVYAVALGLAPRKGRLRALAPLLVAGSVVASLSVLRSSREGTISGMFGYAQENQEQLTDTLAKPWENDLPGPAAVSYLVVNNTDDAFSIQPLTEVGLVLIPRIIYDRGMSQADAFAKEMYRNNYYTGAGMGWSMLCDGYRLLGLLGAFVVAAGVGGLGISLQRRIERGSSALREQALVLVPLVAPVFFLGPRLGLAVFLKIVLIVVVVSFAPYRVFRPSARREDAAPLESGVVPSL